MTNRWNSLKEAIFGVPEEPTTKKGKVLISKMESYGSRPSSTFAAQVKVFEKDAIVRESIIHTAMEIIGGGFLTTFNEDYNVMLPKGEGEESWTAKEAIDFWNEENNFDEKALTIAIELVAYGNSFLYITPTGLKHINIEAVGRALPHKKKVPIIEEYDLELTGDFYSTTLKWGTFIHFRSNVTSSSDPLGTGVVSGLIESYDSDTPSLLEAHNAIRTSMKLGFDRFGQPNEIYSFLELDDPALEEVEKKIKDMSHYGNRITVNTRADIVNSLPERVRGYDEWVKQEFDAFIMALGDPSLKASIESGFTEASIRGSIELFRKKVQSIRRVIKRLVEKLWSDVLTEYGFDPAKAQMRLDFGSDEVEWTMADLLNAVNSGKISDEEYRIMAREKAHWKLEKDFKPKEKTVEPDGGEEK